MLVVLWVDAGLWRKGNNEQSVLIINLDSLYYAVYFGLCNDARAVNVWLCLSVHALCIVHCACIVVIR